jgi:ABC-2 type transport system permease protein
MQSKTSWFNKELILQGFRSTGWLGIIYFLGLFFALPLRIIMYVSEEDNLYRYKFFQNNNLFSWNNEILTIFAGAVPVLIAIFIFRYIQTKNSSDLFHSLPVKRGNLFYHFVGIGSFLIVLPVLLNMVILFILLPVLDLSIYFTSNDILYWAGVTILLNLVTFIASVLVGMVTGISIIHGVLSYIFLFLPIGLCLLLTFSLEKFLFGFTPNIYTESELGKLSSLTRIVLERAPLTAVEVLLYLALIIVLFVASIFIYQRRRLEAISNPIIFPFLKPIFKYGVTFCTMLLGGLYFGEVQISMGWTVFGYVIGSIVGYLVAEMILQKTWRVLGSLKGYLYYVAGVAVLFLIIHFDVLGYEGRVPEASEIEKIYHGNESYMYLNEDYEVPVEFFYEKENFENIIKLHQTIIDNKSELKGNDVSGEPVSVFIAYELKSGKRIIRDYLLPASEYAAHLKPIYESTEYKLVNFRAMRLEASEIGKIIFSPAGIHEREVRFTEQAEIEELLTVLKEDIQNLKYEQYNEPSISNVRFDLKVQDSHYETHHSVTASHAAVEKWLKEKESYEKAVLTGNDFEYAIILDEEIIDINEYYSLTNDAMLDKINSLENTIKITNSNDLLKAWKQSEGDIGRGINIVFKFKNQPYVEFRVIDEKVATKFK